MSSLVQVQANLPEPKALAVLRDIKKSSGECLQNLRSLLAKIKERPPTVQSQDTAMISQTNGYSDIAAANNSSVNVAQREPLPGVTTSSVNVAQREPLPGVTSSSVNGAQREPLPGVTTSSVNGAQREPLPGNEDSTKSDQFVTLTEILDTINFMSRRIKTLKMRIKDKERMLMNRIDNPEIMDEMRREMVEELLRQCAISNDPSSATNVVVMEIFEHEQGIADDMAMGITRKDGDGRWLISYLFWQTLCRLQQRREEVAKMTASLNRFRRQCCEMQRKPASFAKAAELCMSNGRP